MKPLPKIATSPKLDIVLPTSADGSSFAMYKAASASHSEIGLPEGTTPQDFFIDAATYQLPHATVTHVRSCPQIIRRGAAEIAQDVAPTIQMFLHVAGEGDVECDGHKQRFGPGDVLIFDSLRGQESVVSAFDIRIVMAARDRVPLALLSPRVHGLRLPGDEPGTRLLSAAVEALVREIAGLSLPQADSAVTALFQLAAGLIEVQLAQQDTGRRRFGDPLLDAAMAYIERDFNRATLTTDAIRAHLGISRSALYRLFAPLGGVEAVIRQRRLDDAMRGVLTHVGPAPSVAELTVRHGFRNETHFVRAFRDRFGVTPLQFRSKIAENDRAWLKEQAGRAGFSSLEAWLGALSPPPT